MTAVVDIEGFQVKNKFYVKELAVFNLRDETTKQWIFRSPFPYNSIAVKDKKTVYHCEKYLHRIRWSRGYTEYNQLQPILSSFANSGDTIYVKGYQKTQYIRGLLPKSVEIKDLENLNCPKFEELEAVKVESPCVITSHLDSSHCALRKAVAFATWLNSRVSYE